MIIIETCPKCGHDLHDLVIATNPPIPQKKCFECGWEWIGEPEQVIRQPVGGNAFYSYDKYTLLGSKYEELVAPDDSYCSLNNIDGYVFTATRNDLNTNTISYERIAEAVERMKQYIKE